MPTPQQTMLPAERIERALLVIRGPKVHLDSRLRCPLRLDDQRLNDQVKRNSEGSPAGPLTEVG